jgi:hypothetical protein
VPLTRGRPTYDLGDFQAHSESTSSQKVKFCQKLQYCRCLLRVDATGNSPQQSLAQFVLPSALPTWPNQRLVPDRTASRSTTWSRDHSGGRLFGGYSDRPDVASGCGLCGLDGVGPGRSRTEPWSWWIHDATSHKWTGDKYLAQSNSWSAFHNQLLIRPDEVSSRIFDVSVLKVADNALRRLLQHCHMLGCRLT